jgi:hypothetical protein
VKNRLVVVPNRKLLITSAAGFAKKGLADDHIEASALCGFGCEYCSSNAGNYLRINRARFAKITEEQLGERLYPLTSPELMMVYTRVLEQLEAELRSKKPGFGRGRVLVASELTDLFALDLVAQGITRGVLALLATRQGLWLIDELDGVAQRRVGGESSAAGQERAHALGFLLTAIEQLPPETLLVATTNVVENVDSAFLARFAVVTWPEWAELHAADRDGFVDSHGGDPRECGSCTSYADAVERSRARRVARIICRAREAAE